MITHTLKQEEDLWYLAEFYYGDAGLWDHIYYANRSLIGDDPESIYPGMQIEIPELESISVTLAALSVSPEEGESETEEM